MTSRANKILPLVAATLLCAYVLVTRQTSDTSNPQFIEGLGLLARSNFAEGVFTMVELPDLPPSDTAESLQAQFEETVANIDDPDCFINIFPGVTLVTQGDLSRASRILQTCARWDGEMVAAILVRSSNEIMEFLSQAARQFDVQGGDVQQVLDTVSRLCPKLRIVCVVEPKGAKGPKDQFPVNVMRNIALQHVHTTHTLYLDMDLVPSVNLHQVAMRVVLESDPLHGWHGSPMETAFIVPAFWLVNTCPLSEFCTHKYGGNNALRDMDSIQECLASGYCEPFLWSLNRLAHSSTDFNKLFNRGANHHDSSETYLLHCLHSSRFEPFVVTPTCHSPQFVAGLSGYGKNKIQWIEHLAAMGYQFRVLRETFVVHLPHDPSASVMAHSPDRQAHVGAIHDSFVSWLKEKYTPNTHNGRGRVSAHQIPVCTDDETKARELATNDLQNAYAEVGAFGTEDSGKFQIVFPGALCEDSPPAVPEGTLEHCRVVCLSDPNCRYFSYFYLSQECVLHQSCSPRYTTTVVSKIFKRV